MSPPFRDPYAPRFTALWLSLTAFAAGSGCVLNLTVGDPDGVGGSGGYATPPPDPTSAGAGGTCPTDSASTGSGAGGGGGGTCVGPDGTGQTAAICDTMEITPSSAGGPAASNCDRCGGTGGIEAPPGYVLCLAAFELFTAGAAESVQACFNNINGAPAYACDLVPVADCVRRMYNEACPNQAAADTCQLIHDTLCVMNEPFDVTACTEDMNPFNDDALQHVANCIAYSTEPDCRTAYTVCFDQITSW